MLKSSTLRPGFLVSLKTSTRGNIDYVKRDIERDHIEKGKRIAKWETTRKISDPEEFERATTARTKAINLVRSVCAYSAFGLLCPEDKGEELAGAIAEARRVVTEFNDTASLTRVDVYVITGRVAQDDVEAVRAINSEIRELLSDMQEGLRNLDAKAVRAAAAKAKSVGQMLSPEASAKIQIAIDAARKSATAIVAAGEKAAVEVDRQAIKRIQEQRVMFLDLDEAKAVAKPKAKGRAVELSPEDKAYNAENAKRAKELAKREREYLNPKPNPDYVPENPYASPRKPRKSRAPQLELD